MKVQGYGKSPSKEHILLKKMTQSIVKLKLKGD
jgi:hypothetical protein